MWQGLSLQLVGYFDHTRNMFFTSSQTTFRSNSSFQIKPRRVEVFSVSSSRPWFRKRAKEINIRHYTHLTEVMCLIVF